MGPVIWVQFILDRVIGVYDQVFHSRDEVTINAKANFRIRIVKELLELAKWKCVPVFMLPIVLSVLLETVICEMDRLAVSKAKAELF